MLVPVLHSNDLFYDHIQTGFFLCFPDRILHRRHIKKMTGVKACMTHRVRTQLPGSRSSLYQMLWEDKKGISPLSF